MSRMTSARGGSRFSADAHSLARYPWQGSTPWAPSGTERRSWRTWVSSCNRPGSRRRPPASAFGWRRRRPVPISRAHLSTVDRWQQQRHRALLIGMGARQRIAMAVHRRLLLLPFNLDTAQPLQRVAGGRENRVVQLHGRRGLASLRWLTPMPLPVCYNDRIAPEISMWAGSAHESDGVPGRDHSILLLRRSPRHGHPGLA